MTIERDDDPDYGDYEYKKCDFLKSCHPAVQCVFAFGHGGDHRFPRPGDGDLSSEIRERVLLDRIEAAEQTLTGSEALYGFCGWLTSRDEVTAMGSTNECGGIATLVQEFCRVNNLSEPREDWTTRLTHPPGATK